MHNLTQCYIVNSLSNVYHWQGTALSLYRIKQHYLQILTFFKQSGICNGRNKSSSTCVRCQWGYYVYSNKYKKASLWISQMSCPQTTPNCGIPWPYKEVFMALTGIVWSLKIVVKAIISVVSLYNPGLQRLQYPGAQWLISSILWSKFSRLIYSYFMF